MKFDKVETPSQFLSIWLDQQFLEKADHQVFVKYYRSYLRYFPDRIRFFYDRQLEEVNCLLKTIRRARVLEIGCGTGSESLWMALQGAEVHSVDPNTERLAVARARKEIVERDVNRQLSCKFIECSLLDLDSADQYDLIWMEQAFHHLEPRDTVVELIARKLRPGAHLVISEVNGMNPFLQVELFLRRGFPKVIEYKSSAGRVLPYGDERVLCAGSLSGLFGAAGIRRKSISYFRVFPNRRFFDGLFGVEKAMPTCFSFLFSHYNYVGQKPF